MNALVDITKETVCLKEIKDILDELNSVSYIFGQQITVVESIIDEVSLLKKIQERDKTNNTDTNLENDALKYQQVLKTLKRRNKDIEGLKTNAYKVYKDVSCSFCIICE
jgi:hypothetical protein